ncbi:hypothetical protein FRC07_013632 [Ceratobasidium sp. 392]|nr:hypothetical protein FRC07_013632 [Ceratobasidium sp. 392]
MQRTSDFYDQRPQQLRLEDAELCRGYELYVDSTISEAESKGLISGQGAGGSGADVSIIGAMLTLYYAALRSNTTPPSIQLHRDTSTRGIRLRLQPSTCPPEFLDLFDRWAGAVPQIKGLPRPYQIDLERIICNQPPLTAPPHSNVPAYDSGSCSIYDIAKDLKSIALDILRYRFDPQQRHMISASPRPSLRIPSQPLSRSFPVYGPESPSSEQFASLEISNRLRSQSPVTGGSVTTFLGSNYGQRDSLGGPIQRYKPTSSPLIASGSHIPFAPPASFDALESRSPRGSPTNNTFEQAQSNLPNTIDMTRATNRIAAVISSEMSISDIIDTLGQHDCQNITQMLDISSCSVRPMARGGFGDVYLGKLHDGTAVAVKSIFIRNEGQNQGRKHFKRAARELHTWSRCNHPNVARLLGLAQFRGQIAMVSLWMENGDLRAYVNKYPDVDRFKLCTQVADGLSYLHSIRIVHGDLKGPNVLVSKEGVATIIDLGNAILDEAELQFTNTQGKQRLSIRWTAPEIFAGGGHSYEADVYGLGMTILVSVSVC